MAWHTGSADGYLELLQDLVEIATNSTVSAAAVNAGGSGYTDGDVLAINGGTTVGGHTAAVEVLTTSGGAVATVRIARCGSYTVNPGTGATTTAETGVGTGCTVNTTLTGAYWTLERRSQEAVSAVVGGGGASYTVGDLLTVVLGDGVQGTLAADAVFEVTGTSGGAVTTVTLDTAGNYEESPTNDVQVTGGSGTGCTLTVTWQDATTQDQVVVLSGSPGGGFADPYIAIETYQDIDQFTGTNTCYNWGLFGLVNFNSALAMRDQVNRSPGIDTTGGGNPSTGDGRYILRGMPILALKDTDASYPLTFWISVTGRRIFGVIETTNSTPIFHYPSFYLGFYSQAGTRGEYPYPLYVGGASWRRQAHYAEVTPVISGISEASGYSNGESESSTVGTSSAYFWDPGNGRWYASINFRWNDSGTSLQDDTTTHTVGLYPLLRPYYSADPDPTDVFALSDSDAIEWYGELIDRGLPTAATCQLLPTPNGGTDLYLRIPLTLVAHDTTRGNATGLDGIFGELDQCFYVAANPDSTSQPVSTLDSFLEGSDRYRVFQNGNRTQANSSYMVVLEA